MTPVRDAQFSPCGRYRYLLTRKISDREGVATFIMLNPSTADGHTDDPTIRKCMGFCERWGYGALNVLNLFAVGATDPRDMKRSIDPVGCDNRTWFDTLLTTAPQGVVVCAWGVHGTFRGQDRIVLQWLEELSVPTHALALTKRGAPRHPLYVPYSAVPMRFTI